MPNERNRFYISLENVVRGQSEPEVRISKTNEGNDDIIKEDKDFLGTHLAKSTKDPKANQTYYIQESNEVSEVGYRDSATGLPAKIETDANSERNRTFYNSALIGPSNKDAKAKFEQSSNTGMFDDQTSLGNDGFKVAKGKMQRSPGDGYLSVDELLSLEGFGIHKVGQVVSTRQQQTGRFSSDNQYISDTQEATENNSGTKSFVIQKSLGQHAPHPPGFLGVTSNNTSINQDEITVDQLKNIGIQMMIKSSGELYQPKDETDSKYATLLGSTLVPGLARLGQRVKYDDFSAGNIMDAVNPNYSKPNNPTLTDENRRKLSFGNPYNPIVPFDGFFSDTAAITAGAAMAAGISGVILALAQFAGSDKVQNFIRKQRSTLNDDHGYETHINNLGQSTNSSRLPKENDQGIGGLIPGLIADRENILGLVATKNEYKECVKKGLNIFFNPKNKDARNILLTSPNYANTILRVIVRDAVDLGMNVGTLANNGTQRNFQNPTEVEAANNRDPQNAASTVDATFRMISQIRDNRMIKFMNVLALLGDSVLVGDKIETYTDNSINKFMTDANETTTFGSNLNLKNFHKKSRLSNQVNKNAGSLAWSSNTAKSMYILPKELGLASNLYLNNLNAISNLTERNYFKQSDTNRLSHEQVKNIEEELDSSYMPFYFHDLRTNEIVSFHAFLDSVSDSFDTDYSETEAYGRLGKVYKWKNTNRSINLGFYVVATNPQDFDEMYFKINKLITMQMPQYTEGRTIAYTNENTTHKFTQPFSQIPASSPLIRMRLGDFLKSNFAKFDLAKLFGVGNSSLFEITTTGDSPGQASLTNQNSMSEAIQKTNAYQKIANLYKYINIGFSDATNLEISNTTEYELTQPFFSYGKTSFDLPVFRGISTVENIKDDNTDNTNPMIYLPAGTIIKNPKKSEKVPGSIEFVYGTNGTNNGYFMFNGMPSSHVRPTSQTLNTIMRTNTSTNSSISNESLELIRNFLSNDNNAIFKAFESTSGEGVPGFIRSIKLDVDQSAPWGTDPEFNDRAPKILKISLDYLPIFDLNPGLDSNGFMIGAPYNVGKIMKSLKEPDDNGTPQNQG